MWLHKFFFIWCLLYITGCGFKSDSKFAASRLKYGNNQCADLYITDSYSFNTNNDVSAKQIYKIETKAPTDKNYRQATSYPVYHSFINNNNLVSNIMINKHIRQKACKDYYLTNMRYFE